MRFIEPSFEILSEDFTRENVLTAIELAARTCYKSEDKICEGSAAKLVSNLIKRGHEAMLEHAPNLSVRFICDRGVSHELVRHRLFSFAQESTRYVNYSNKHMQFIIPEWITGNDRKQYSEAYSVYSCNLFQEIYAAVDDVITNDTNIPLYVKSFRAGYYHDWNDQTPYINFGNTYFSYSAYERSLYE